jgi:hypothetical protein
VDIEDVLSAIPPSKAQRARRESLSMFELQEVVGAVSMSYVRRYHCSRFVLCLKSQRLLPRRSSDSEEDGDDEVGMPSVEDVEKGLHQLRTCRCLGLTNRHLWS